MAALTPTRLPGTPDRYRTSVRTWEQIADLPLRVEGYGFERLAKAVSSGFERVTTDTTSPPRNNEVDGRDYPCLT